MLKNDDFKTRDFSPLIERVITGVQCVNVCIYSTWNLYPCLKDPRNSEKGVLTRLVQDFEWHDKNDGSIDYDVALIKVSEEIPFDVSTQDS